MRAPITLAEAWAVIADHYGWTAEQLAQAAQPAHAHSIDTSPERVEKQAGDVQVPEGWKLVPVEPTEAMLKAGNKHTWPYPCVYPYKAMLSAAINAKVKAS